MLDRQHLAIVREVQRTGSFTAAAERLNVSQSALSHAVAKFEERHGARIWDRTGRSLRLTRAGEHLARLAARFLPELEHAERLIGELARGHRGTLRIGMECHPCEKWLMRVTAPFLKAWPDVDLDVRNTFRADGADALRVYEIDMLATPDPVADPLLTFEPVCDYDLSLVVPKDHALAGKDSIDPPDLAGETLFTLPVPVERLDIFMRFLLPADIKPGRRIEIETTELMLQMAAAGRGLTVLPDWIAREAQTTLPIRAVRIGTGLGKSINLGYRTADRHTDFITAFVEMARAMPRV